MRGRPRRSMREIRGDGSQSLQRTEGPPPGGNPGDEVPGRITLDEYFMRMAHLVKERGTCRRRKVGAVIIREKMVGSTGCNGAPRAVPHCSSETGCLTDDEAIAAGRGAAGCLGGPPRNT